MNIFVAGAASVIGRAFVPLLVGKGYDVVGTTRSGAKVELIRSLGARPVIVDVFDRDALLEAVLTERPNAIIHQLTDLSAFDLAANARLRVVGTRNLVDAARAAGVRRIVAQSISFAYAPGSEPAGENDPLDLDAPPPRQATVAGVQALERAVAELPEGVILRYGTLYGPRTWLARDGRTADAVWRGAVPATDGVTSFVHVADAARAAVLALDWPPGPVNVVDDEPVSGKVWLPIYAAELGAPPPPLRDGSSRGERGASNARARQILGWQPLYSTWREGFQLLGEN